MAITFVLSRAFFKIFGLKDYNCIKEMQVKYNITQDKLAEKISGRRVL